MGFAAPRRKKNNEAVITFTGHNTGRISQEGRVSQYLGLIRTSRLCLKRKEEALVRPFLDDEMRDAQMVGCIAFKGSRSQYF